MYQYGLQNTQEHKQHRPTLRQCFFYRTMLFSAKRGLAIACRLSVRPSVTLVDHDHDDDDDGARTISPIPTPSLFVALKPPTYSQGNMGKFWGDYRGGLGKSGVLEQKSGNISETRKDRGKVRRAYSNSPALFRTISSPTPYGLLFHKIGGSQPPPKTSVAIISGTGKARDFKSQPIRHFQRKGSMGVCCKQTG